MKRTENVCRKGGDSIIKTNWQQKYIYKYLTKILLGEPIRIKENGKSIHLTQ